MQIYDDQDFSAEAIADRAYKALTLNPATSDVCKTALEILMTRLYDLWIK